MTPSNLRNEIAEIIYGIETVPTETHLPDIDAIIAAFKSHLDTLELPKKFTEELGPYGYGYNLAIDEVTEAIRKFKEEL